MPAPTVSVKAPPPLNYPDTILRPQTFVSWSGGTGPTYDVLHEWDDDNLFGSPIQDLNAGVSGPDDTGTPPSDMGPAGTTWYYRVTVTDNFDATSTTSPTSTLNFADVQAERRDLYTLANVGVAFFPTDTSVLGEAVDGDTQDFRRYLYTLANVDATTPTPHIWYLFPTFGREGWEFKIVGYGFGDTQVEHTGTARLNALAVGIISWAGFAEVASTLVIDPAIDLAEPVHQEVRATVPTGAVSGLVFVETDDV